MFPSSDSRDLLGFVQLLGGLFGTRSDRDSFGLACLADPTLSFGLWDAPGGVYYFLTVGTLINDP